MIYKITIEGIIPSKKNSRMTFCRGGRPISLPSNRHRDWHKDASLQLKNQNIPEDPILHCTIAMTIFAKDKRRFDLSNRFESVADLLVDCGVLADDSVDVLPDVRMIYGGIDRTKPRAEIEIEV